LGCVSRKPRNLHPEERALWKRVAATVKPRRPVAPDPDEESAAQPAEAKRASVRQTQANAPQKPAAIKRPVPAPPQKRDGEKRVRRGKLEIDGSFDLHGYTQDGARAALISFLQGAHARGARTVIVVTGKGRTGEGVLKKRFPDWIASAEIKPLLAGYAQAHRDHGGAGAFYVFLKRKG
jgi:DNA-nicking Smr family endonuclease